MEIYLPDDKDKAGRFLMAGIYTRGNGRIAVRPYMALSLGRAN
jgi:hypothetical protein